MSIKLNTPNKIIALALFGLLVGSSLAILPLYLSAGILLLIAGICGVFLAYRWPEFFLILAIWTYFLKFTFLFSLGGLGITPFMVFEILALSGYGLRILSGKQRLIFPVGTGFLLLFVVFTTLSLLLIRDIESALGLFFRTVLDWMLMLLLIQVIIDRQSLKKLIVALLLQAIVIISWGIIEAFQSWLVGRDLTSYSSFFWNQFRKNDFAIYLVFVSLISLAILLHGRNRLEKFLGTILLIPIPVAWLITRSRSGLLAFIVGLLLFFILEQNAKLLRLLMIFMFLGVISFAIFPSQERDLALDGIQALINPENVTAARNIETIDLRFELMEAGWQVFISKPLLGVGFNQWQYYSPISNSRRDARTGERIQSPLEIHNRHLGIAANSGIFALAGYLCFGATIFLSSIRARQKTRGLVRSLFNALIAIFLTIQLTFTVTTGFLYEWVIFGMLIGLINLVDIEKIGDIPKRRWLKLKLKLPSMNLAVNHLPLSIDNKISKK